MDLAEALKITEEEHLVPLDGSSHARPKLVLVKGGCGAYIKVVAGVEVVVAKELVGGPMKLIRAGFGNHIDERSANSKLGGRAGVHHRELLNHIGVGKQARGAVPGVAGFDAVIQVAVIVFSQAADDDGHRAGGAPSGSRG